MSENNDDLFGAALGEYRDHMAVSAGPFGEAHTIRDIVVRRRRVRLASLSALGVLLIVLPIAAFAGNPRGNNSPPLAQTSSPKATVTDSPKRDGQILVSELENGKVTVDLGDPACGKHLKARPTAAENPYVAMITQGNLDRDPALETAVVVQCEASAKWQYLAFERGPDGSIVALGTIVEGVLSDGAPYAVGNGQKHGGVELVLSWNPGGNQIREYGWDGSKFVQVAGPTDPPGGPNDHRTRLAVTAADLKFRPPVNGVRSGTLTLTVQNKGDKRSGKFYVGFSSGNADGPTITGADWVGPKPYDAPGSRHPGLNPGETVTVTVTFSAPEEFIFPELGAGIGEDGANFPGTTEGDIKVNVTYE